MTRRLLLVLALLCLAAPATASASAQTPQGCISAYQVGDSSTLTQLVCEKYSGRLRVWRSVTTTKCTTVRQATSDGYQLVETCVTTTKVTRRFRYKPTLITSSHPRTLVRVVRTIVVDCYGRWDPSNGGQCVGGDSGNWFDPTPDESRPPDHGDPGPPVVIADPPCAFSTRGGTDGASSPCNSTTVPDGGVG